MKEKEIEVINAKRDFIAANLDATQVMTKLRSKSFLSEDDYDIIKSKVTRREKCDELLTRLLQHDAFFPLLEIFMSEGKTFIAEDINNYYEEQGGQTPMNMQVTQANLSKFGWRQDKTAVVHKQKAVAKSAKVSETKTQQHHVMNKSED